MTSQGQPDSLRTHDVSARQPRYHRAGPWLEDLRRLHRAGFSDQRIADELSLTWSPLWWTRRQVLHWRRSLNLPASPVRWQEFASAWAAQRQRWRDYQAERGFGHLLPYRDTRAHRDHPGHELTPLETRILATLAESSGLTRRQLRALLRHSLRHGANGRDAVAALVRRGLVRPVLPLPHQPPVYQAAVSTRARQLRPDTFELLWKKLSGWGGQT